MDSFEGQLRQALARTEPDAGFDGRVLRRMQRRYSPWLRIAAAVLVMLTAGEAWRWHQGQVAKEQVLTALRLAGGKLSRVQTQLRGVQ